MRSLNGTSLCADDAVCVYFWLHVVMLLACMFWQTSLPADQWSVLDFGTFRQILQAEEEEEKREEGGKRTGDSALI